MDLPVDRIVKTTSLAAPLLWGHKGDLLVVLSGQILSINPLLRFI